MAKEDKYSVRDLKAQFPTDAKCLEHLFDTLHTRECSCGGRYNRLKGRLQFQCSKCRHQIAPLVGTIFQKSSTPLTLWFHAMFIFSNAKSGISAKEMERQLGVTYKTAWRMLHLIRKSLKQNKSPLKGDVEMDEAYFGGKGYGGVYNKNQKKVMKAKTKVIAAIERSGETRARVVPNLSAGTIGKFLKKNVLPFFTHLMTDKSNRYSNYDYPFNRLSVDHGRKQYVGLDNVHINTVESFWSHVKRSLKGVHKSVSKKYFQEYLDGFVWHRNNRHNDNLRFASLLETLLSV